MLRDSNPVPGAGRGGYTAQNASWERCKTELMKLWKMLAASLTWEDPSVKNEVLFQTVSKNILPAPIEGIANIYPHDGNDASVEDYRWERRRLDVDESILSWRS